MYKQRIHITSLLDLVHLQEKLYFDFYYLKEIEVNTTCWDNYVTYWIRELGDSPGMTVAEYEAQNQDTLRRVEKNGDDWAAMGRVEKRRVDLIDTAT